MNSTITTKQRAFGIDSFILHLLAMALMLSDHIWATVASAPFILTYIGRLAFPLFAFMVAEGFYHTKNLKKYALRMFIFAIVSEIPFNLMTGGSIFYYPHQNVMWTFLLAIGFMSLIELVKKKNRLWLTVIVSVVLCFFAYIIGFITMVDYFGFGILTVLLFYFFRENKWWQYLFQLIGMIIINVVMFNGMTFNFELFGHSVFFPEQGLAVFALIPIWLYNGRQGPYNKVIQMIYYSFYPVHMLILSLIALL